MEKIVFIIILKNILLKPSEVIENILEYNNEDVYFNSENYGMCIKDYIINN